MSDFATLIPTYDVDLWHPDTISETYLFNIDRILRSAKHDISYGSDFAALYLTYAP